MIAPQLYSVRHIERPSRKLLYLYLVRTLAMCLLGPWFLVALLPMLIKYRTLSYQFDEEGVGVRWGLLWRRETHLTYARIQDIHLSRGLLERWLNLATIHVQTASGSAGAEISLVGLEEYELVRDYLYHRMRGSRSLAPSTSSSDEVLLALRDLKRQLEQLSKILTDQQAATQPKPRDIVPT